MFPVVNVFAGNRHRMFLRLGFAELPNPVNGCVRTEQKHLPLVELFNHQKSQGLVLGLVTGHRSEHVASQGASAPPTINIGWFDLEYNAHILPSPREMALPCGHEWL